MRLLLLILVVALGCGDSDSGSDGHGSGAGTGGDGDGDGDDCEVPTGEADLTPWLEAGDYEDWAAESAPHGSGGPHFGDVRVYINDELEGSLEAGDSEHPKCAASVKELYGDGTEVLGHSVMLKLAADSAGGDNWYWYERFEGSTLIDAQGASACTGCHGGGNDFSLSPFPLQ